MNYLHDEDNKKENEAEKGVEQFDEMRAEKQERYDNRMEEHFNPSEPEVY